MNLTADDGLRRAHIELTPKVPQERISVVELKDEDLNVEQLPLLLTHLSPAEVRWEKGGELIGPDGSKVKVVGKGNYSIRTPIYKSQIPWIPHSIHREYIRALILDLLPCREGSALLNPSPWRRRWIFDKEKVVMESGEINLRPKRADHDIEFREGTIELETHFYNPLVYYQNPLYVNWDTEIKGSSVWFSLELDGAYGFASSKPITLKLEPGFARVQSLGQIASLRGVNWSEMKLHRLSFDMSNPLIELECAPLVPLSLYRLEPSTILPLQLHYEKEELTLGFLNLSETPVMGRLILAGRILEAWTVRPDGSKMDQLFPELDTLRIPMRRWGVVFVKMKVRKLLSPLLKKYQVT
jgi:hypothetical protein